MREIKFRGRNANLPRCWIYGYLVIKNGIHYIVNDDGEFKIIAGTENQYTGLKDKNGKEIYEGGLFQSFGDKGLISKVIYKDGCFGYDAGKYYPFVALNNSNFEWKNGKSDKIETVGDVYENPEILKDVKYK